MVYVKAESNFLGVLLKSLSILPCPHLGVVALVERGSARVARKDDRGAQVLLVQRGVGHVSAVVVQHHDVRRCHPTDSQSSQALPAQQPGE